MDLSELQVFLTVASERSFSRAAAKLHRTQPAVSQAIRRLEDELGERLFDRSSKQGALTEAGRVLREYAQRLMRLSEEAEQAVRELRDLRRGRVLIGANEAAVHALLPLIGRFRAVTRTDPGGRAARAVPPGGRRGRARAASILASSPSSPPSGDFTRSTWVPTNWSCCVHPQHPMAGRKQATMAEFGREVVIAHNDPSPARERVLRAFEQKHAPINIQVALPSLEAIKRAVELRMGVALLPKRCALSEIAGGKLAAVRIPQVRLVRQLRLVYRRAGDLSHAAQAFLVVAKEQHPD